MSRPLKIAIAVGTALQLPGLLAILLFEHWWLLVPVALLWLAVSLFYIWDIGNNSLVTPSAETNWRCAIGLAGPFAEAIYFYRFVWPDEPV